MDIIFLVFIKILMEIQKNNLNPGSMEYLKRNFCRILHTFGKLSLSLIVKEGLAKDKLDMEL